MLNYTTQASDRWPFKLTAPVEFQHINLELAQYLLDSPWWQKRHITTPIGPGRSSVRPTLRVLAGYAWDGASIPGVDLLPDGVAERIQRPLMRGSLLHDVLYQALREGRLKPTRRMRWLADKEYRRLIRQDGVGWFRAEYQYRALRLFGWRAAGLRWWQ
jgi:hypothetical protein